jgi:catechol 2,3-dioxygenase-like lactoylglutathione lyase family enzyme
MSVIQVEDVAFVGFAAPDLTAMRGFMEDFGATVAHETDTHLYMRGAGAAPFVHVTVKGEPGFASLGLRASSLADLDRLAVAEGASVEKLDAPGGGSCVDLLDPDGRLVRVVAGQIPAEPLPLPDAQGWNWHAEKPRLSQVKRTHQGPAHIVRLGHCVLNVANFRTSENWYKERFGFITSDEIEAAPGMAIGAFMRCDRGEIPTDHHTLFLMQAPTGPGFNHAAFEVADMDDLEAGHSRLVKTGRQQVWGVGRHLLGSQVFDYWRDPWGHMLEHWTDGDMFTAADGSRTASIADLMGVQWGPNMPPAAMK